MGALIVLALLGSFVGGLVQGLTGFGIALVFLMVWAFADAVSLDGARDLTFPVALLTILSPATSVSVLLVAWRKINWPLSLAMCGGMGATWPLGMWLLLHASAFVVHSLMSIFFFAFSLWRLHVYYTEFRTARDELPALSAADESLPPNPDGGKCDTPHADSLSTCVDEHPCSHAAGLAGVANVEIAMRADGSIAVSEVVVPNTVPTLPIANLGRCASVAAHVASPIGADADATPPSLPSPSPPPCDPEDSLPPTKLNMRQMGLTVFASLFGGLFGGMLGAYGPPLMALFTVLPCHKHEIRASVCLFGFLILPLRVYLAVSNSLFKVRNLTLSPPYYLARRALIAFVCFSCVFCFFHLVRIRQADDWVIYCAVSAAALAGTWLGNKGMAHINTKLTMLAIINLLFLSSVSGMEFLGGAATPGAFLSLSVRASFP